MATADSAFLTHAAEVVFDLGLDRFRLTALTVPTRRIAFAELPGPARPPVYQAGGPPASAAPEGRRPPDWRPAADAPAWLHLAWLLDDLAAWTVALAEERITVTGLEAPRPEWCDLLLRDGDTSCRARITLADRATTLDFPGMYLCELLAEGRYRDQLVPAPGTGRPLIDLRGVL
ncbi:hypothetical protein [Streptomyces yaizuensis]|uniref:Uncharacterized protein n=1 Tax=Streptomyces yaizuensis TaxID=2989713 RepID=A0ABQ5NX14_9ACTN|nr:hypothetical protein [Streptomyces sp. YSPA8]GLF94891.1 hypothetical protein SYYSPA8_11360 [Streptomyces sp. YSPA8]